MLALVVFALAGTLGNPLILIAVLIIGALNGLVVGFIFPPTVWQQAALGAGAGALLGIIPPTIGPVQIVFGAVVGVAVCETLKRTGQA